MDHQISYSRGCVVELNYNIEYMAATINDIDDVVRI